MQIVVLAPELDAGARTQTDSAPQQLLMTAGRPLVDWQLERFAASGAKSIVMCVGPGGEEIEAHARRALHLGLSIRYSYERGEPVGTGGALRRALARLEPELVLTYGEAYLPIDYSAPLAALRAHPELLGMMTVVRQTEGFAARRVGIEAELVTQYSGTSAVPGSNCLDCGAVALRRSVVEEIADGAVWGIEALFRKLARKRQLGAFLVPDHGFDTTVPEELPELEWLLKSLPNSGRID
jgi:NDP-sugar pyrophosphorylase family protein